MEREWMAWKKPRDGSKFLCMYLVDFDLYNKVRFEGKKS